ncbi:M15 family metallopeptidase [Anaerorhabdus sp.]|uniref:M15 family metallopeptidase n=1 Tax=Anaerorhabdus sp. TaxID=1872524 RepID=UPI002FCB161A
MKRKRKIRLGRVIVVLAVLIALIGFTYILTKPIFDKNTLPSSTATPEVETPITTPNSTPSPTPTPTPVSLDHTSYDSIYVIINKTHPLPEDYEPTDLVVPNVKATKDGLTMRKEAAEALEVMFNAAKEEGHTLIFGSGYRSYSTQERLFNNYVARDGEDAANRYSARPGQSEHQTGLAADIGDGSLANWLKNSFKDTPEGIWLKENSYKYGFVLRFMDGKEDITGYMFEPWHFRYVGVEEAQKIVDSGLTLEEFYNFTN